MLAVTWQRLAAHGAASAEGWPKANSKRRGAPGDQALADGRRWRSLARNPVMSHDSCHAVSCRARNRRRAIRDTQHTIV